MFGGGVVCCVLFQFTDHPPFSNDLFVLCSRVETLDHPSYMQTRARSLVFTLMADVPLLAVGRILDKGLMLFQRYWLTLND